MTSDALENDAVELAVRQNLYMDPEIVSLPLEEATVAQE